MTVQWYRRSKGNYDDGDLQPVTRETVIHAIGGTWPRNEHAAATKVQMAESAAQQGGHPPPLESDWSEWMVEVQR